MKYHFKGKEKVLAPGISREAIHSETANRRRPAKTCSIPGIAEIPS